MYVNENALSFHDRNKAKLTSWATLFITFSTPTQCSLVKILKKLRKVFYIRTTINFILEREIEYSVALLEKSSFS